MGPWEPRILICIPDVGHWEPWILKCILDVRPWKPRILKCILDMGPWKPKILKCILDTKPWEPRILKCILDSEPWGSWILIFCLGTCLADLCQGSKKVRDPGFAESKVWDLDGSWTLHVLFAVGLWKPRTSKLCYAARPWKPRTSRFWYAVRPWKPRTSKFDSRKILETQDLKSWICGETLETQETEPQNFNVSRLKRPWSLHHSIQNFMLSIVPGSSTGDELGRSDSKNLNSKK